MPCEGKKTTLPHPDGSLVRLEREEVVDGELYFVYREIGSDWKLGVEQRAPAWRKENT